MSAICTACATICNGVPTRVRWRGGFGLFLAPGEMGGGAGPGEIGGWSDPGAQAEATARATDYASKDNVIQTRLLSQPGDNVIVTFDQGPDKIKVQTERTVPLFFAKLFLGPTKRITAYAA